MLIRGYSFLHVGLYYNPTSFTNIHQGISFLFSFFSSFQVAGCGRQTTSLQVTCAPRWGKGTRISIKLGNRWLLWRGERGKKVTADQSMKTVRVAGRIFSCLQPIDRPWNALQFYFWSCDDQAKRLGREFTRNCGSRAPSFVKFELYGEIAAERLIWSNWT
jgi:hypothetical protein